MDTRSHAFSVAALVQVDPEVAFAFLADGLNQRYWALGSWDRRALGDDLFVGTSLFDGEELFVRVIPHPELLLVDFETGPSADALAHEVSARVVPGHVLGHPDGTCVVTLTVLRTAETDAAAWEHWWHVFHTELPILRHRLESGTR